MKMVYRVLALLIAFGVTLQAAAVTFGMFGMLKWVEAVAPSTSPPSSRRRSVAT